MKKRICLLFAIFFFLFGLSACTKEKTLKPFSFTAEEYKTNLNENLAILAKGFSVSDFTVETTKINGKQYESYSAEINSDLTLNISPNDQGEYGITLIRDGRSLTTANVKQKAEEFMNVAFSVMKAVDSGVNVYTVSADIDLGYFESDFKSTVINNVYYAASGTKLSNSLYITIQK